MIKVTAAKLLKLHACKTQVALFRQLFPNGLVIPKDQGKRAALFTRAAVYGMNVEWYVSRFRMTAHFTNQEGTTRHYRKGRPHRDYYPAVIYQSGGCEFWRNGSCFARFKAATLMPDGTVTEPVRT